MPVLSKLTLVQESQNLLKKKKLFHTLKFCLILAVQAAYYVRTTENMQQQKFQAIQACM